MCARSQINNSSCEENEEINRLLHKVFVIRSEAQFLILFHKHFLGIQPIVVWYVFYFCEVRK